MKKRAFDVRPIVLLVVLIAVIVSSITAGLVWQHSKAVEEASYFARCESAMREVKTEMPANADIGFGMNTYTENNHGTLLGFFFYQISGETYMCLAYNTAEYPELRVKQATMNIDDYGDCHDEYMNLPADCELDFVLDNLEFYTITDPNDSNLSLEIRMPSLEMLPKDDDLLTIDLNDGSDFVAQYVFQ